MTAAADDPASGELDKAANAVARALRRHANIPGHGPCRYTCVNDALSGRQRAALGRDRIVERAMALDLIRYDDTAGTFTPSAAKPVPAGLPPATHRRFLAASDSARPKG